VPGALINFGDCKALQAKARARQPARELKHPYDADLFDPVSSSQTADAADRIGQAARLA
jgi:hypothetical protein